MNITLLFSKAGGSGSLSKVNNLTRAPRLCRYLDMRKRTPSKSQDINQFAAVVVRQTIESSEPEPDEATISQVMRAMGRRGGIKGAATLNARLTPAQRKASARRAAKARWGKTS
jgi:hypothetical protein